MHRSRRGHVSQLTCIMRCHCLMATPVSRRPLSLPPMAAAAPRARPRRACAVADGRGRGARRRQQSRPAPATKMHGIGHLRTSNTRAPRAQLSAVCTAVGIPSYLRYELVLDLVGTASMQAVCALDSTHDCSTHVLRCDFQGGRATVRASL